MHAAVPRPQPRGETVVGSHAPPETHMQVSDLAPRSRSGIAGQVPVAVGAIFTELVTAATQSAHNKGRCVST